MNRLLNTESFLQDIKSFRTEVMGVAIISVLIYHAFCWIYNPIGTFNIGYFGVDIFMFLSGFGLCFSYEKNSIDTFYKNRFLRIMPLYIFSVCIAYAICFEKWNFAIFFENLTTLGFYIDCGKNRFDWYINALITLYLLFPLCYRFSKYKHIGLIILTVLIIIAIRLSHPYWWYNCFISRLPIFIYGIAFKNCHKKSGIIMLLGLLLYLPCKFYISPFLATSFIALPIIYICLKFLKLCNDSIKKILNWCGQYSLEIYLANVIIYTLVHNFSFSVYTKFHIFIFVQITMTAIFIFATSRINRIIKKW